MIKFRHQLGRSQKSQVFFARFGVASLINTLFGVAVFPVAKTVFEYVSNDLLIIICYVAGICFSFTTHGKLTFVSVLTIKKFLWFFGLNVFAMIVIVIGSTSGSTVLSLDIRLVQPVLAVAVQVILIFFYQRIFLGG